MLPRAIAVTAYLVGIAGAGIFFAYVVLTGSGLLPQRDAERGPLPWLINLGLLLMFALQHSGMARRSFKAWFVRGVPAELERSMYVAASGTAAALLICLWQPLPGKPIWHGPIWISAISLLAGLGIGVCCGWFDHASFFGLTQAWTGVAEIRGPLLVAGPYRYVRHPLMLGLLLALWAQPVMPPELFWLNAGMTCYILIAIRLEERDLCRDFGAEYEKYRRAVPMLIPWRVIA